MLCNEMFAVFIDRAARAERETRLCLCVGVGRLSGCHFWAFMQRAGVYVGAHVLQLCFE